MAFSLSVPDPARRMAIFAFAQAALAGSKSRFLSVPPVMRMTGPSKESMAAPTAWGIVAAESRAEEVKRDGVTVNEDPAGVVSRYLGTGALACIATPFRGEKRGN